MAFAAQKKEIDMSKMLESKQDRIKGELFAVFFTMSTSSVLCIDPCHTNGFELDYVNTFCSQTWYVRTLKHMEVPPAFGYHVNG